MMHNAKPVCSEIIINFSLCCQIETASYSQIKLTRTMQVPPERAKLPRKTPSPQNYIEKENIAVYILIIQAYIFMI